MAQRTRGLHAILGVPAVYAAVQRAVGGAEGQRRFIAEHLRPRPGDAILDVGCGPGAILDGLTGVDYLGIDLSPSYIEAARARFGGRGTFLASDVNRLPELAGRRFDIVLACGLLHHLEDGEAIGLFARAFSLLRPGGRMVTIDPCFSAGQSFLARWLIAQDRGRNVRSLEGYLRLARTSFPGTMARLRHDLLRLPYTHIVLEAPRPPAQVPGTSQDLGGPER